MLDVNGLWSLSACLEALPVLSEQGVVLLEQPVSASDEVAQARIVQASSIDIAADESVFGPADVARIGRLRTATVINLGLSKMGGILRARESEIVARASALDLTVGSVLELGVATAAGLHLAAAVEHLAYPSYLVGPLKYEQEITWPKFIVKDGRVQVPDGPGLGVEMDADLIASLDLRAM
jgi:muconate cycloisomerase